MINQKKIIKELITKDSKLEKIFDTPKQCPFFAEPLMNEEVLFFELAQSIVGQQISAKAAEAIWKRIIFSSKNKKEFLNFMSNSKLKWARQQGLSEKKYEYIKSLANKIITQELSLVLTANLSDKEAIRFLSSFRGVGPWTAEMFLMFAYKRLDIFSIGDIALRKAISDIYNVNKDDFKKILQISNNWKPYRSVVCWYLWEYLGV